MDPNVTLNEMVQIAGRIVRHSDRPAGTIDNLDTHDANALAERVIALNDWLRAGGALPSVWTKKDAPLTRIEVR